MSPPTAQSHRPTLTCLNQISACSASQFLLPWGRPAPPHPYLEGVSTTCQGFWAGARVCVRVAGSLKHWLTPSYLHAPPHPLPSSQTTNTPTQHQAGAENTCILSAILLHFSPAPPPRPGHLAGDTGWESRDLGLSPSSAPNPSHMSSPAVITALGLQATGTGCG